MAIDPTDFDLDQDWDQNLPANNWDTTVIVTPPPPPPPGGGAETGQDQFRYLTMSLLDREVLAELPLKGVSFSSLLGDTKGFQGGMKLGDPRLVKLDAVTATIPERTALFVEFSGALVWGGVIWAAPYESDSKTLAISAEEFGSYYQRQYMSEDQIFNQVDQLDIVRQLIVYVRNKMQPNSNIHTTVSGYQPASGRLRDRTYNGYEYKEVMDAIDQLSKVIDGFDWFFDVRYDETMVPSHTLTLSYPERGAGPNTTELILDYPGNISKYSFPNDQSGRATKAIAIGSGEGNAQMHAEALDQAHLDSGWPLTEATYSYKDIIIQSTLQGHAEADLVLLSDRFDGMKVTVPLLKNPRLGTYGLGDAAKIQIQDDRFPHGITGVPEQQGLLRLIGTDVHPESNTVDLTLASMVNR